MEGCGS